MKYANYNVEQEFLDLVHRKVNEEFAPGDQDYVYGHDVNRVLKAAQWVFEDAKRQLSERARKQHD